MARPKSPRKTSRLTITLDDQALAALSAVALENDGSIAWVARRAITEFLNRTKSDWQEQPATTSSNQAGP